MLSCVIRGLTGNHEGNVDKGTGIVRGKTFEYAALVVKEFERKDLGADRIYARLRNVWAKKLFTCT